MTEDQLEAALRDLGTRIDVPAAPDVTAAVRSRLHKRRRIARPVLTGVLALILAFAVACAVSPAVRSGVVEFLKFAGIEFRSDAPPPVQELPTLPSERTVSLEEARKLSAFEVYVPTALGTPKEVRVADGQPPRFVSLVYESARVDEFDGSFGPAMEKFAGAADVEVVSVNGTRALWVSSPHEVVYVDRNGQWLRESAKLSGTTLIWEVGAVTIRLEGDFTKDQALAIASVR